MYCIVLCCAVLCCIVLYSIVLYCILSYCIVLFFIHDVILYLYNETKQQLESGIDCSNDGNAVNNNECVYVGTINQSSSSPIVSAWNTRQLIKFDSETNIVGNIRKVSTICSPIKHDGIMLGILKLTFHR